MDKKTHKIKYSGRRILLKNRKIRPKNKNTIFHFILNFFLRSRQFYPVLPCVYRTNVYKSGTHQ